VGPRAFLKPARNSLRPQMYTTLKHLSSTMIKMMSRYDPGHSRLTRSRMNHSGGKQKDATPRRHKEMHFSPEAADRRMTKAKLFLASAGYFCRLK
jgi:hypothetical protein